MSVIPVSIGYKSLNHNLRLQTMNFNHHGKRTLPFFAGIILFVILHDHEMVLGKVDLVNEDAEHDTENNIGFDPKKERQVSSTSTANSDVLIYRLLRPVSFFSYLMRLPANKRLKRQDGETAETLKKALIHKWQKLEKMLICSEVPQCVVQYKSTFRLVGKDFELNLIQSLSFTIQQIKEITDKLKKTNNYVNNQNRC